LRRANVETGRKPRKGLKLLQGEQVVSSSYVETGRKPRKGLKLDTPVRRTCSRQKRVETGRKPRKGLKQRMCCDCCVRRFFKLKQGENPGRD